MGLQNMGVDGRVYIGSGWLFCKPKYLWEMAVRIFKHWGDIFLEIVGCVWLGELMNVRVWIVLSVVWLTNILYNFGVRIEGLC